jgi:hypothetical protein
LVVAELLNIQFLKGARVRVRVRLGLGLGYIPKGLGFRARNK